MVGIINFIEKMIEQTKITLVAFMHSKSVSERGFDVLSTLYYSVECALANAIH